MPVAQATRLAALDGLRGAAAVGIVAHHAWMFDHGPGAMSTLDFGFDQLRLAVPLFFVLSGFLVYRPFVAAALDRSRAPALGTYVRRRAARILPAYWLVMLVSFVLLAAIVHPLRTQLADLPSFLVFAQNYREATHGHLNPPSWTLAVEASFYAVIPLIAVATAAIGARRGAQAALCAALVGVGVALTGLGLAAGWPRTVTTSLLVQLPIFAAGMTVAVMLHRRQLRASSGAVAVTLGTVAVLGAATTSALKLGDDTVRAVLLDLPAAIGFALIVGGLAGSPMRARLVSCRPMRLVGALSYGIYLWHFPVIYALRAAGLWPSGIVPALAVTLVPTLVLAWLSWVALERPVLRLAHRRAEPRRAPAGRWKLAPSQSRP